MSATYDVIFAGGGASACVTAGRLADADPTLRILVLEAGSHSKDLFYHVQPGRFFSNILTGKPVLSFHVGQGGKGTGERFHIVPSGRAVGGGSSINFLMYTRPAASDFDDWETVHGNKGWSSKEIIPLLKKAETYQPNPTHPAHGSSGPIKISFASTGNNVGEELIAVGQALKDGRGSTNDINDFSSKSLNSWGMFIRYVDSNTGKRSDAAHGYIYNKAHPNLTVQTGSKVLRVLFDGTRAVGVEYVDDKIGRAKCAIKPISVRAARLVVLSSGAFGSPAILERSGVGSPEILKKNGVEQLVNLPGVGKNYMDHNVIFTPYLASEDATTMDLVFRGHEDEVQTFADQWTKEGKGLFANNGIDGGIRLRPKEAELKEIPVSFEERWKSYYANKPDKPILMMATMAAYVGLNPEVPRGKYFSVAYFSTHPLATGHVHITSGTDLYAPLDFYPGFLEEQADLAVLAWGYKRAREVARRMKYFRGELAVGHPLFPAGSAAAVGKETKPLPIDAPPIVYTTEDDLAIDEYHKSTVETCWHSIGTCAMKPREQNGVVDSKLNVYGTQNLKVADCSITPANVAANTYSTAIAIGEKAAVIIAEELGIIGVVARP
ncbi:Alcohol oxidase [Psilocybe cubensis]|uniref:Alcohol oxidase n=1 Tax=Psilocybe cubensis TaxID=181762 RepID=A0ACB8H0I0_PSICU|nr:Alcohol oxidase [Psilocybe cubensis]KAH9481245.1 Alcohol oxidase [Psilocybe cubensis]